MGNTGIVAVAVTDNMPIFELAIACGVFGTARTDLVDPWYELRLCTTHPGMTETQCGLAVPARYGLDALADADTVIIPALSNEDLVPETTVDEGLLEAIRVAHANGARVVSLCTGAFALAEAGLLDGRSATTHWMHTEMLAARYPKVQVDAAALYVADENVLTSAGRTAGLDLCLHLVRSDLGAEVANQVARRMVVSAHRPGGQAQYIESPISPHDDGLAPVLHWATEQMGRQLTVADIARHAGFSSRTLVRRFHDSTGTTPMRWLLSQRLGRARGLLESTDLSIDRISELCGLGTAGNFRYHFTRSVGVTPTEYRAAFRDRGHPFERVLAATSGSRAG